ncbi:unnamed protein product, partial [Vitis vinifera]
MKLFLRRLFFSKPNRTEDNKTDVFSKDTGHHSPETLNLSILIFLFYGTEASTPGRGSSGRLLRPPK